PRWRHVRDQGGSGLRTAEYQFCRRADPRIVRSGWRFALHAHGQRAVSDPRKEVVRSRKLRPTGTGLLGDAFDFGSGTGQLLLDALVAAIDVIDAVDDRVSLSDQRRN